MITVQRKSFAGSIELKAGQKGSFRARIATLNVVDADGDVTLAGAFPVGKTVAISAYGHGSWNGALPVGKGVIGADHNTAWVDGQFFDTTAGRDTLTTVTALGPVMEWSHGYFADDYTTNYDELKAFPGAKRILKRLDIFEASPVLKGAGVGTQTEWIKAARLKAAVDPAIAATVAQIDLLADTLDELVDTLMDEMGIADPDEAGEPEEPKRRRNFRLKLLKALAPASTSVAQLDLLADKLDELVDTLMDLLGLPDPDETAEGESGGKGLVRDAELVAIADRVATAVLYNQFKDGMLLREIQTNLLEVEDLAFLRWKEVPPGTVAYATRKLADDALIEVSLDLHTAPPRVRWFTESSPDEPAAFKTTTQCLGAANDPEDIWIKSDLLGTALVEVVAHETRHVLGYRRGEDLEKSAAEALALEYGAKIRRRFETRRT